MLALLPTICLFACAISIAFEAKGQTKLTIKAKLLASLSFVAFAWTLGAWQSSYGQLIFIGLLFSLVGDVMLAMKGRSHYFIFGIGSFLLAHLVYTAAFLSTGFNVAQLPLIRLLVMALLVLLIITGLWLKPHLQGSLRVAVPVYLAAIGVMLITAWGSMAPQAWIWIISGASLFAVSDLFVARQRFIKADICNRIIGLPMYYVAQILLAFSISLI